MKVKVQMLCAALVLVFALVGCDIKPPSQSITEELRQDNSLLSYNEIVNADTLSILNGAGTINITSSNTDELAIECTVAYDGKSDTDFNAKTKGITLTPKTENGIVYLEVMSENNLNYWQWLEENINVDHIKVNYTVKIPSYITDVRVVNAVGELSAKGINTSLELETYVGNIECKELSVLEHSNIYVATGNIDFSASSVSQAKTILNGVGVGNIICGLPQNAEYSIDNNRVPETSFTVDRELLFNSDTISSYREQLTTSDNAETNSDVTIIGNKSGFGRVTVK